MTSLLNSIKNLAKQTGEDTKTRFSVEPAPGDSGFTQWQSGMRMVARLPEGIPPQFRKTLWLNLAEKHLVSRGVQWEEVEDFCFNEYTNPDDEELGVQIVKDVHRTGCSLFCGVSGKDNQALLKRVLLAYARWNKAVGYCQGFNMLAALILQVMDKSEVDSVKVMIYLIEGVLPESYFANNLRGLSVDMAVFRDLLRIKLPTLSRHFDQLQCDSKDSGTSYEPPLTNVFTMQWFLTLFCNCLPQDTVLRVWDLIFLEGNHILLSTALAIWSTLSDRILSVESADEFYCIMGVLTREMLEFGLMDANALIKAIVSFNLPELGELRERYLYNITPWTQSVSTVARRGLRLFYSDDDTDTEEDDEKIAIATAYGLFKSPKKKEGASGVKSPPRSLTCPDKERIAMDISALTKQYRKLRERQKQAHVILTAACGSQGLVGPTTSPAMNHLLMGKFALVNSKGRRLGPPPGSIPPPSQQRATPGERQNIVISGETLHWKDADSKRGQQKDSDSDKDPESAVSSRRGSSSSSSTELCDDPHRMSDSEDQTNSLSECCPPPDKPEPSTPLKLIQPKLQHPDDIESCKEETEESTGEKYLQEELSNQEERSKEDNLSISPDPSDLHQPKRKSSFRIDPEELRQLDRKLSLKIVEIERRKSSAGIESEDLNSKVLFPFDRDYIQEKDKADRGSPSSIPDDRMCSMDDFIGDFEEETILVPDLITTHRPSLSYHMTSLEECDESKVSETADVTEFEQKGSFDSNEGELRSFECTESLESNDDNECENSESYNKIDFDELFNKKTIENNDYECLHDDVSNYGAHKPLNEYLEKKPVESEFKPVESESKTFGPTYFPGSTSTTSQHLQSIEPDSQAPSKILECSNDLNSRIEGLLSKTIGAYKLPTKITETNNCKELNTDTDLTNKNDNRNFNCGTAESMNSNFDSSERLKPNLLQEFKSPESFIVQEGEHTKRRLDNNDPTASYCPTSRDKVLEQKLESLMSKLSIRTSEDSSLPDVTAVSSREFDINSLREKYANFGKQTIDLSTDYPTYEVPKHDELLPELTLNVSKLLDLEVNNVEETISYSALRKTHESVKPEEVINETVIKSDIEMVESETNKPEFDEFINEPSISSKSNRRGSEVALSLILKENSQILSKIQQQSRRSSEVSFRSKDDQVDDSMRQELHSLLPSYLQEIANMDTDLVTLNKDISDFNNVSDPTKSAPFKSVVTENTSFSGHVSNVESTESNTGLIGKSGLGDSDLFINKSSEPDQSKVIKHIDKIASANNKTEDEALPDICRLNIELNKAVAEKEHYKISEFMDITDLQRPNSKVNDSIKEVLDQNTVKEELKVSGLGNLDEYNSMPTTFRMKTVINMTPSPAHSKPLSCATNSTEEERCYVSQSQFQDSSFTTPLKDTSLSRDLIESPEDKRLNNICGEDEDILNELRYLDIKLGQSLECSVPKNEPSISTLNEVSFQAHRGVSNDELTDNSKLLESNSYSLLKYKHTSFDHGSDPKISRSTFKNKYTFKAASVDTVSLDKLTSNTLLDDSRKSFTASDDDNVLYMSSYKNHGRLLIEAGDLSPYKSCSDEAKPADQFHAGARSLTDRIDESAYGFKMSSSKDETTSSEPFSRSMKSPECITGGKEKKLYRYKSEDLGRGFSPTSPTHYRFSSASPVRKRLDPLISEFSSSPHSTFSRNKSPSPTAYSLSEQHVQNKEKKFPEVQEISASQYSSKVSRDYGEYSRTESLDIKSPISGRSSYLRRRAESFESSSDRSMEDKKVTSPPSPVKFNPFPVRSSSRQPKELGVKLGLYLPPKSDKSPSKRLT